jgi:hypothetical protein
MIIQVHSDQLTITKQGIYTQIEVPDTARTEPSIVVAVPDTFEGLINHLTESHGRAFREWVLDRVITRTEINF